MNLPCKQYFLVFAASSVFVALFLTLAAPALRSQLSADKALKHRESSLCTKVFLVATTASSSPIKGKVVVLPPQYQLLNQQHLSRYLPGYDRSISQDNAEAILAGKSGLALAYGGSPIYLNDTALQSLLLIFGVADTVVLPWGNVAPSSFPYQLLQWRSTRYELLRIREC